MTASSDNVAFVDSNVLIYALDEKAEHFRPSHELIDQAEEGSATLYVTPQILAEVYAIITDHRRTDQPWTPKEATDAITDYQAVPGIELVSITPHVVEQWTKLVISHAITGQDIFDTQIVASMLTYDVVTLYTFNVNDFAGFLQIDVRQPSGENDASN